MEAEISKIESALAVAFLLPAVCFVIGMIWGKMVGGWRNATLRKGWITFCLVLPIVFLGMILKFGYATLRGVWLQSPFLSSVAYTFVGIVVPALLIAAAMRLWRPRRVGANHPRPGVH
jgi:hypothetical protein